MVVYADDVAEITEGFKVMNLQRFSIAARAAFVAIALSCLCLLASPIRAPVTDRAAPPTGMLRAVDVASVPRAITVLPTEATASASERRRTAELRAAVIASNFDRPEQWRLRAGAVRFLPRAGASAIAEETRRSESGRAAIERRLTVGARDVRRFHYYMKTLNCRGFPIEANDRTAVASTEMV